MKEEIVKVSKQRWAQFFGCVAWIILLSLLLTLPFLISKNVYGHDIKYHYEVIRSLDEAFKQGNFSSRILGLIGQDYGYGTGLFYSLIPSGIAVLFMNIFHMGISNAIALELFLLLMLAGIVMFLFAKRITKSNVWATVISTAYLVLPYTLSEIYIRFAFSEMFLLLALPLIFWGAWELVNQKNIRAFFVLFSSGYTLGFLTHFTMTLIATLFVAIYFLCYIKEIFKSKLYIPIIIAAVCAVLISCTYWLPMVLNRTHVQINKMNYGTNYVSLHAFYSSFYPRNIVIEIINIFVIVKFAKLLRRNKGNNSKQVKVLFALLCVSFGMSTFLFPWFILPDQFGIIQFAFRLHIINTPFVAISIYYLLINHEKKQKITAISLIATCVVINLGLCLYSGAFARGDDHNLINKQQFECVYNGKSENYGLGANKKGDYYPTGASKEYVFNRASGMIVSSNVKITEFANYQSINQISFVIKKQLGSFAVLNLPYELFEDVEIYQISDDRASLSYAVTKSEKDGLLKLDFAECGSECKITLLYQENSELDTYLKQHPFEFVVKSGEARFSEFRRGWSDCYTVNVEIAEKSKIELPTFYYKGYVLTLETDNGTKEIAPIFGENGFIEIELNESGTLRVEFKPNYVKTATIISIAGAGLFLCLTVVAFAIPKKYTLLKRNEENLKEISK